MQIKTKLLIMALLCLLLTTAEQKAQTFTGGITLGLSTTSVNISDIDRAITNVVKGKNIMGFETGVFARLNMNPVFIKSLLLLSYQGGVVDYYNNDGTIKSLKFTYGKLEIPLLFGLKIIGPFRIEGGPVYNWIYTINIGDLIKIEPSGLGYRAGANIELANVNLGIAYQGLTNKSFNSSSTTFKSPNELIFSVGICFGKDNSK